MSSTPPSATPSGDEHAAGRTLGQHRPGDERHEHDLDVGQHGGQPGADVLDRVVPEDEVGGEEHTRADRRAAVTTKTSGP